MKSPVVRVGNELEKLLAHTPNGRYFENIGYCRNSGIAAPAFSLYSDKSPIGDFGVKKLFVDFCHETNSRVYQDLPLNCTGFNHCPYAAESGFALDGIYLSLEDVQGLAAFFSDDIRKLNERFPIVTSSDGTSRVDYALKRATLEIAEKMFRSRSIDDWNNFQEYRDFKEKTAAYWLEDYVLYRTLKESHNGKSWEDRDTKYKSGDPAVIEQFKNKHAEQLEFQKWLQWQLFEQGKELKAYAGRKNVLIMGDMPFLPSRDSADVWIDSVKKTNYFDLTKQAGALPDMYFADGQLWGNPVPNWDNMAKDNFRYIREKRRYASNFYHIERKDHEIGQSRLYINDIYAKNGKNGSFLPPGIVGNETSERLWQAHHKEILLAQIKDPLSEMLYTSEGLGVPPKYMRETLAGFGIPDISVQRWTKEGPRFIDPKPIMVSTLATHDCTPCAGWFEKEAGTIDRGMFENLCELSGISPGTIIDKLFDRDTSSSTRLRWKKGLEKDAPELKAVQGLITEFTNTVNERNEFLGFIGLHGDAREPVSTETVRHALERSAFSPAMFHIPTIYDLESLKPDGLRVAIDNRPNTPGIYDPGINWNWRAQRSVNQMLADDEYISYLRRIYSEADRTIPN